MTNKTILMTMTIVSLFTVGITLGGIQNVYAPDDGTPEADANGPYSAVLGNSITFDGTGSFDPDGDALSFDWTFGDGNTGTGPTPTHTHALFGTYDICLTVADDLGSTDSDCTTAIIEPIVDIDIKPGSDPNSINLNGNGIIPVAILGTTNSGFNVLDVDVTTLAFGPNGATPIHRVGAHFEDVNGDGYLDLVSHFRTQQTGIVIGDLQACITGEIGGIPFRGCDDIRTIPEPAPLP